MLYYKKGITLIEVLTVLAVMAVLSSIAYPQYTKYIRQARQLEAKTSLGAVYEKQLTYLSSELKFSESLKTIGAVPAGPIRYNIGTDWRANHAEDTLNQDDSTDLCPCNDQNGAGLSQGACWADPNPEGTGDCSQAKCYGGTAPNMAVKLGNLGASHNIPSNGFHIFGGKFEYYAIGCTSPSLRQNNRLDVWSINHKKNLKNIRPGF